MSLWTPRERVLRRPDGRSLVAPHLSAEPLGNEIDYDDLRIHHSWRIYEDSRPDEVRYLMYQLSQRDLGSPSWVGYYKAVRFLRVTRVPRYLRQVATSASGTVFDHQRKLLAGLREQGVVFINLVANTGDSPLIFAYGVQAIGTSPEEAQAGADRATEVLSTLLDGVYQQLDYKPLTVAEAEALVRYQTQWRHIAMARGRPKPLGADGGTDSWLDGNRTDVENTQNMLESFIRGMSDRPFLMSLVTVPISPQEMTLAWKNIADRLSEVRSEQSGSRSITAGVGLPMTVTAGESHGDSGSHQLGFTQGHGTADSQSITEGLGYSHGVTEGSSLSHGVTHGQSASVSHTDGVSQGLSHTVGASESFTAGHSAGESVASTQGTSLTEGIGVSQTMSHGVSTGQSLAQSVGLTHGQSTSFAENWSSASSLAHGVTTGRSLAETVNSGVNWSSSIADTHTAGINRAESLAQSHASAVSQAINLQDALSNSIRDAFGNQWGSNLGVNTPLGGGGVNAGQNDSWGRDAGHTNTFGLGLTSSGTNTVGLTSSLGESLSRGVSLTDSLGGSYAHGTSATNSVGQNLTSSQTLSQGASIGRGESIAQSLGTTASQSVAENIGTTSGLSSSTALGRSDALTAGVNTGQSLSHGTGASLATSTSLGVSQADTTTRGSSVSVAETISAQRAETATRSASVAEAIAASVMANRAQSDAYVSTLSRSVQQSHALGAVPSFGMMWSRNTFNEASRVLGDVLEAQMRRYVEGTESGAFFYQLFLLCPDQNTLSGAAALLKSSFWGAGTGNERLPQPFHVATEFDPAEAERLHTHAVAFTHYRKRERRMELIETYAWSTYLTPSEGAAMTHPPTAEAIGLQATHDSMPVFAMPSDRSNRDLYLGHLINGERARTTTQRFGIDIDETTHVLVAGTTGSGKTTMLTRLLVELARQRRELVEVDPDGVTTTTAYAGALVVDWGAEHSYRGLATLVGADRFRLWNLADRRIGGFRYNLLALPADDMDPFEWAGTVADLFMIAYGLGEYARNLFYEIVCDLYTANRLEEFVLRPEVTDPDGVVIRPAITLPALSESELGPGTVAVDPDGVRIANVRTHPQLSRLVGLEHVAVIVAARIEAGATPGGRAMGGPAMQDRLQTVWRRVMNFAPGAPLHPLVAADLSLSSPTSVALSDLVDPDRGLFTVLEVDGLDQMNRRLLLGGILQALFRWGQRLGGGGLDHRGRGPGTWLILEEAHELFGQPATAENSESAATRAAVYESLFRRARQHGLHVVAAVQNPADVPDAILGNCSTVICHRIKAERDRKVMASLFNWVAAIGQHYREFRYLGEMRVGHCIIGIHPNSSFLGAAPVHVEIDPPVLPAIPDETAIRLGGRH